jgi:hypothetical protein
VVRSSLPAAETLPKGGCNQMQPLRKRR